MTPLASANEVILQFIYRRHLKITVILKSEWYTIRATAHAA